MKNICVIGSGSWGVALAMHLANLGNNIKALLSKPRITSPLYV